MNYEVVFATNNKHKLQEVRKILSPHGIIVYGLNDINIHPKEIKEDGNDYFSNALIKGKAVQQLVDMPIISDDSGLEIHALDNRPGLHSARFAKQLGGHEQAIIHILDSLKDKDRSATFVCCIVMLNVEKKPLRFESRIEGQIAKSLNGKNGFGYDPIFIEKSSGLTYAEMDEDTKNKLSHRAKALKKLITYLKINQLTKR